MDENVTSVSPRKRRGTLERKKKVNKEKPIKIKFRHRHPILFYSFWISMIASVLVAAGVAWFVKDTLDTAPTITEEMLKSDGTSNMYDINGNVIWSTTEIRRDYIKYEEIPQSYIDMLLPTEQATYFEDGGFSWKAQGNMIRSSIMQYVFNKGEARGGSSIEQQLIKNVAFDTASEGKLDTIKRKIQELWLSQQLDENFSKEKILEFYVNKIFLGENSYGIETITKTYFGLSLKDLAEKTPENLSKLAIIAGLGQSPSTYNLYDNPEAVKKRRDIVLYESYEAGKITEAQYRSAVKVDVLNGLKERYWRNTEVQAQVAKYNAYISSALKQVSDAGYDLNKTPLQIYTYLDPAKYEWLTDTVNNQYFKDDLMQVAITVMDTKTGIVLAQSGGRYEEANGLNRATQLTRSSGSSMKPFIGYGPLIEYFGYASNSLWDSSPYTYPGTNMVATNYGGASYGMVTMKKALAWSLNTPVNRALDEILGSSYAKEFLARLNLDIKDYYAGSDALGLNVSTELTAAAYAAIANEGKFNHAKYVSSIKFSDGSTKDINKPEIQGMRASTAYILADMLEATLEPNSSATNAAIHEFQGYIVKTGLSNYDASFGYDFMPNSPDSWVSGATKSITVSIWTGYDSPNEYGHWVEPSNMTKYDLIKKIMRHYNEGLDTSEWNKPSTVTDLGGDFYKPNDTVYENFTSPANIAVVDMTSLLSNEVNDNKNTSVSIGDIANKKPADYKIGSWIESLSEENKKIYEFYKSNNGNLPTYTDVLTEKVFDNTN